MAWCFIQKWFNVKSGIPVSRRRMRTLPRWRSWGSPSRGCARGEWGRGRRATWRYTPAGSSSSGRSKSPMCRRYPPLMNGFRTSRHSSMRKMIRRSKECRCSLSSLDLINFPSGHSNCIFPRVMQGTSKQAWTNYMNFMNTSRHIIVTFMARGLYVVMPNSTYICFL